MRAIKADRRRVVVSVKWFAWGFAWVSEESLLAVQFGPLVVETWRG